MFYYVTNLTDQKLHTGNPWEFQPTEKISVRIRGDKEERQMWYGHPETKHQFYTGIEPMNPQMRPGKDNPPFRIHAFCADYDVKIPDETVAKAIEAMRIKPAWIERSLGGNIRLVWTLEQPLLVDDTNFCAFVLDAASKWLKLELLPALDLAAFTTTSRLLCNGCEWKATGHPAVSLPELQSFFVACGKDFRFKGNNEVVIPFDVLEKACKEKFPNMQWPGIFEPGAQGPTFWIPESTSPMSAIIKETGIVTFSAHATKVFHTWADILGADFVRQFTQKSVSAATADVYWDSKRFHRKINGVWCSIGKDELMTHFKVDCQMSAKPAKGGVAPTEVALQHIYTQNRIEAAVPFVFRPAGLIVYQGERILNTYTRKPVAPATGKQEWGPQGNFPVMSAILDNFFFPIIQKIYFLAWFKHYYESAFYQVPNPGQNLFLMGFAKSGKTLLNRRIIGTAVGGFVDASDYLVGGVTFNSHLFYAAHWALDDDTPANNPAAQAKLYAVFKKTAANQQFSYNKKFEVAGNTEWMGRIGCTTNLDFISSRIVGPLDDSSMDKTCLFKCSPDLFEFPNRQELDAIISRELPYLLRWLLDWQVPDFVKRDSRYGFAAYHEETLLDRTHQTSPAAPFKELLMDTLHTFFSQEAEAKSWKGTASQLVKLIASDPLNESIMRSIRLDSVTRYLEQIERTGDFKCQTSTGHQNTRIWEFPRLEGFTPITPTSSVSAVSFEMPPAVEKFV